MKKSTAYQPDLFERLRDAREAEAYLNAALEENDPELFLMAFAKCRRGTRGCRAARGKCEAQPGVSIRRP